MSRTVTRKIVKIAFLDRDGTITKDYPDNQWNGITEPVFIDGSIEAMRLFRIKGYKIIVITNQYLIGEGYITQKQYDAYAEKFIDHLGKTGIDILDIFYCPHARDAGCSCSKPKPGMIEAACMKYPGINIKQSFYAGDWDVDIILANTVGVKAFGIGVNNMTLSYTRVDSLSEIGDHI